MSATVLAFCLLSVAIVMAAAGRIRRADEKTRAAEIYAEMMEAEFARSAKPVGLYDYEKDGGL